MGEWLISCDPGKHWCWFAAWRRGQLVEVWREPPGPELAWTGRPKELAIEVPQVYPGARKEDPNDLIDLAISAGVVIGSNLWQDVTLYRPREWKGQTPKQIDNARTLKVLTPEERSVYDGCDIAQGLRHNVLDAIGIGLRHLKRK